MCSFRYGITVRVCQRNAEHGKHWDGNWTKTFAAKTTILEKISRTLLELNYLCGKYFMRVTSTLKENKNSEKLSLKLVLVLECNLFIISLLNMSKKLLYDAKADMFSFNFLKGPQKYVLCWMPFVLKKSATRIIQNVAQSHNIWSFLFLKP